MVNELYNLLLICAYIAIKTPNPLVKLRTLYEITMSMKNSLLLTYLTRHLHLLVISILTLHLFFLKDWNLWCIPGIWLIILVLKKINKQIKREAIVAPDTTDIWLLFPSLLTGLNYRSDTHLTSIWKTVSDLQTEMHIYPSWKTKTLPNTKWIRRETKL